VLALTGPSSIDVKRQRAFGALGTVRGGDVDPAVRRHAAGRNHLSRGERLADGAGVGLRGADRLPRPPFGAPVW
jgi:hypothetical protein